VQAPTVEAPSPFRPTAGRHGRSNTDLKSIFVGNMHPETTEFELRNEFEQFGQIRVANIITKPITGMFCTIPSSLYTNEKTSGSNGGVNCFAFLEFESTEAAHAASCHEVSLTHVLHPLQG